MTDLFAHIRQIVLAALNAAVPGLPEDATARVEVSPTKDASHGDMATNATMVCAKAARQPPAKIAAALAEALRAGPDIVEATVAGPGFVNNRASESPTTAPRQWPMCIGPVGLAETYSTFTRTPWPAVESP